MRMKRKGWMEGKKLKFGSEVKKGNEGGSQKSKEESVGKNERKAGEIGKKERREKARGNHLLYSCHPGLRLLYISQ